MLCHLLLWGAGATLGFPQLALSANGSVSLLEGCFYDTRKIRMFKDARGREAAQREGENYLRGKLHCKFHNNVLN